MLKSRKLITRTSVIFLSAVSVATVMQDASTGFQGGIRLVSASSCDDITTRLQGVFDRRISVVDGLAVDTMTTGRAQVAPTLEGPPALEVAPTLEGAPVVAPALPGIPGEPQTVLPPVPSGIEPEAISNASPGDAPVFSGTNVQEKGVDEPDFVKTNGVTIFQLSGQKLRAIDAGDKLTVLSSVTLENVREFLLIGDTIVAFGETWSQKGQTTSIISIDVSDPTDLRVSGTAEVSGGWVAARKIGNTARVVVREGFWDGPGILEGDGANAISPTFSVGGTETELVACSDVRMPPVITEPVSTTVFTVDPTNLEPRGAASVLGGGDTVYVSPAGIYLAGANYELGTQQTLIHQFDISDADEAKYVASGAVDGGLLNQWAMSEHAGILRVATTLWSGETSSSSLITLRSKGGALVEAGRVDGLGLGERIFAVRYLGNRAFVVTFRQVDPLYTLDLSDPDSPQLLGELKIPGFSNYLHPIGEDLLIGVGSDATLQGRVTGAQISLFDVSDLTDPKRLDALSLGAGTNISEDHRGFLYWPSAGALVVPVSGPTGTEAVVVDVSATALSQRGSVTHAGLAGASLWQSRIRRSIAINEELVTVSDVGLKRHLFEGLTQTGSVGWEFESGGHVIIDELIDPPSLPPQISR